MSSFLGKGVRGLHYVKKMVAKVSGYFGWKKPKKPENFTTFFVT